MFIPNTTEDFNNEWQRKQSDFIQKYTTNEQSFILNLLPETAIKLSVTDTFKILYQRIDSNALTIAINPENTIPSPIVGQTNTHWMKTVNMVGINVRTIGSFWNIVKYALTIPAAQSAIHLLPIWEVGVVASLYGISSWQINPEFFDESLFQQFPNLNTVEKQLKVVVNLLHTLGKTVGMDVIPHTDRYAQVSLANPQYFEWLQRQDLTIVNYRANLHEAVQDTILTFLQKEGTATNLHYPIDRYTFFEEWPEENRLLVLFGEKSDYEGRLKRRNALIQYLYERGYEPVPATMAPPYRGLDVNGDETAKTIDKDGRIWRDYVITKPQEMSRVFGPLTRFKLYERKEDNINWAIDFDKPKKDVWDYVCAQYSSVQAAYNFDFMRGDMSHVQMQPEGVPAQPSPYYDILKAVKNHIQNRVPSFAYFAETFLAPSGHMAYGDEIDHLEFSDADSTLGDLQSVSIDTPLFSKRLRQYWDVLESRAVAPNFTILTGDKDDPRFDEFYLEGNEARFFMALFLTNMPSYMALGFETRDRHPIPAPNEHYTKLYVFQMEEGQKATKGAYQWGKNAVLFHHLSRIKSYADAILPLIANQPVRWLLPPDAMGDRKVITWTQKTEPKYVFVVNLNTKKKAMNIKIPAFGQSNSLTFDFSTVTSLIEKEKIQVDFNGINYHLGELGKGEGRAYRII